ncbi:GNAT family N-acetyltransferase [Nostoc sp. FACHB-145]|uniref:GNAT family N-acetyltransferase n=1 Tax=Nostoc sp. FACHB-145 TaxID=2692836 RepID=UPI00168706E5|nr:GNAT family N-acetyltransferase [Nostoc sp. FACHB-145]MBD2468779.1 GNAT family N-acetyltransferase [Nostoc sp. FACHB-145]
MQVLLETERLILRQFTEADVDNLFELDSDPEVVRWTTNLGQSTPYSVVKMEVLPDIFQDYQKYDNYGYWAVIEKTSQVFIGWFLFKPIVDASYFNPQFVNADDIELGYRLKKAAWGKGYATEGSKALIKKAFSEGVERVVAVAFAANLASIRVMEKAGLKLQTKVIYEENNQEAVIYVIDKSGYEKAYLQSSLTVK